MEIIFVVFWVFTIPLSIFFVVNHGAKEELHTEVMLIAGFHSLMAIVTVSIVIWMRKKQISAKVTAQLQMAGFQFQPWNNDRRFGDGKEQVSKDDVGFSLVHRPRGSYHRGSYHKSTDPMGIAVLEKNGRLVELYNSGQMDFRDQELVHITLETPWAIWSEESGREKEMRPLGQITERDCLVLNLIYLGIRDDKWARWMAKKGLRNQRIWESQLPDAAQGLEAFDSGREAFDDFFGIRHAGPRVRKLLTESRQTGEIIEPLKRWQEALFDLHVAERVEVWVDVRAFAGWEELTAKLLELITDLNAFTGRLEAILLEKDLLKEKGQES